MEMGRRNNFHSLFLSLPFSPCSWRHKVSSSLLASSLPCPLCCIVTLVSLQSFKVSGCVPLCDLCTALLYGMVSLSPLPSSPYSPPSHPSEFGSHTDPSRELSLFSGLGHASSSSIPSQQSLLPS